MDGRKKVVVCRTERELPETYENVSHVGLKPNEKQWSLEFSDGHFLYFNSDYVKWVAVYSQDQNS